MLKILLLIATIMFGQVAAYADCDKYPPIVTWNGSTFTSDNGTVAINCDVGNDPNCSSGYCGFFTDQSPINLANLFGVLIDDIATLGGPSIFLPTYHSVVIGDNRTEGAYVQINNCCGDWAKCSPYIFSGGSNTANFTIINDGTQATPNMAKPAVDANLNLITNAKGKQLYCPLLRANVPTNDIWFRIDSQTDSSGASGANDSTWQQVGPGGTFSPDYSGWDDPGAWTLINYMSISSSQTGDQVCLSANFPTIVGSVKSLTISCKYAQSSPPPPPVVNQCGNNSYLDNSCTDNTALYTVSEFTFVGKFMQCIQETLNNLFLYVSPPNCPSANINLVLQFQVNMRQVVALLLTLYVIAFGIRIAAGGELPKKQELFMFVIKIGLVTYFAVGSFTNLDASAISQDKNGLIFYFTQIIKAMSELANNVIQAGNTADNNFCVFNINSYPAEYQYLALWDSFDCHIASYLGFIDIEQGGSKTLNILAMIWIYTIGFTPMITLYLTVFAFFMISIMVNFVLVFIIAMLGLAILAYLGPIFIPMALFSFTHKYYENWLSLVFSYMLQPVVMASGLALILVTLDSQMYKGCTFNMLSNYPTHNTRMSTPLYYPQFVSNTACDAKGNCCNQSLGYWISTTEQANIGASYSVGGIVTVFMPNTFNKQTQSTLMTIAALLFLFHELAGQLAPLAADITGGMNLGNFAASPAQIQDALSKGLKAARGVGRKLGATVLRKGAKAAQKVLRKGGAGAPPPPPPGGARGGGDGGGGSSEIAVVVSAATGAAGAAGTSASAAVSPKAKALLDSLVAAPPGAPTTGAKPADAATSVPPAAAAAAVSALASVASAASIPGASTVAAATKDAGAGGSSAPAAGGATAAASAVASAASALGVPGASAVASAIGEITGGAGGSTAASARGGVTGMSSLIGSAEGALAGKAEGAVSGAEKSAAEKAAGTAAADATSGDGSKASGAAAGVAAKVAGAVLSGADPTSAALAAGQKLVSTNKGAEAASAILTGVGAGRDSIASSTVNVNVDQQVSGDGSKDKQNSGFEPVPPTPAAPTPGLFDEEPSKLEHKSKEDLDKLFGGGSSD